MSQLVCRVREGNLNLQGRSLMRALGARDVADWALNWPSTMSESPTRKLDAIESKSVASPDAFQWDAQQRTFSWWQLMQIRIATWIGYAATALVGRSLRWQVFGWENYEAASHQGNKIIFTFWHREIFSATWFWRKRGIVVMTSRNFDGEYIARIIQKHGYGVARGSTSRGATRALKEMIRAIRNGRNAAFTIDGPRGPRFLAKPGAVLLSKATGAAILCFHIAPAHSGAFRRSWDQTEIPYPFSRAAIFIAEPIAVSREAGESEQAEKLAEVQATLDKLRAAGEAWRTTAKRGRFGET
jgi:lysophospholipid acyltransferase (LPLAT)-like uncharacterized protein